MHLKCDNIEIMINDKVDKVTVEIFQSLLSRYQTELETSMGSSDCIFDCVHLLYYKCHKISFKQGSPYINSPDWIRNKNETINRFNKNDSKCVQYATTVLLNHEETGKYPERITKIKPFIDKYNQEGIN